MKRQIPAWFNGEAAKCLRLAHLRRLKKCEQVAAVCYRMRRNQIEFLLVRTRGGRWTFPKGGTEPGLTHAQAAALEAFEEAGVHGRIEEEPFTGYIRRKRRSASRKFDNNIVINAYLCEVRRLETPAESNRHPTWFSPDKARRKLGDGRSDVQRAQLVKVIDRAVARIQRFQLDVTQHMLLPSKVTFIDHFHPRDLPPAQSR
jgi:8-oxo-dGTP pyrophosphatase MutT (NUDIX family)